MQETEDKIIKDMLRFVTEMSSKDEKKQHRCEGAMTESFLNPDGEEFWFIYKSNPEGITKIEYCPCCGYQPALNKRKIKIVDDEKTFELD